MRYPTALLSLVLIVVMIAVSAAPVSAADGFGVRQPANPAVDGQTLYLAGPGLTRFDLDGFRQPWQALADHSYEAAVVTRQAVLAAGSSGLTALDRRSGTPLWRLTVGQRLFAPVVSGPTAYLGGEQGLLYAVAVDDGRLRWRRRFDGWVYSPAVGEQRLFVAGQEPLLRALDRRDGRTLWAVPLPQESVYRPVFTRGQVIVTTFSGDVIAVAAADGAVRWRVRDDAPNHSPLPAADLLLFRTFAGPVKARRASDGRLVWQSRQALSAQPLHVVDGRVLAVDARDQVVILDVASGQPLTRLAAHPPVRYPPAVVDGRLLLLSRPGTAQPLRLTLLPWSTLHPRNPQPITEEIIPEESIQ